MDEVAKKKFESYERVRKSGQVSMLDTNGVAMLSGLTKKEILEIQTNYNDYCEEFNDVKNCYTEKEWDEMNAYMNPIDEDEDE